MPRLNQILAIEKQTKASASADLTEVYHQLQKEALLNGVSRRYQPKDEEGERFPNESQIVQLKVAKLLETVVKSLTPLYNVTAQRDMANCSATADVEIDGKVLLRGVPAVHLLWLEKQLVDLHTLITKLPVLPQTESWEYEPDQGCYKTAAVETAKTKKIPKPFVKAVATEHHPAPGRRRARRRHPGILDHSEVLGRAPQGSRPDAAGAHRDASSSSKVCARASEPRRGTASEYR